VANLLSRFGKQVAGSKEKVADYLPNISPGGDFVRITDLNAILNSWNNILLTPTRTYTYDPDFGSDLYKYLFEPADSSTSEQIKSEIFSKLSRYDDRAAITSIDVQFLANQKGFVVSVSAVYKGERSTVVITIDESSYFTYSGLG